MANKHAILSPSGSEKWTNCAGSARMEMIFGKEEKPSVWAAEGTAAHFLASEVLTGGVEAAYLQEWVTILVTTTGECFFESAEAERPEDEVVAFKIEVTEEMSQHIDNYVLAIGEFTGPDGFIEVEQKFDISEITGEEDAEGTADVVIVRGTQLQVHDLKYGRKAVLAVENKQLLIYAYAAYQHYRLFSEIDSILLVIHQPRVNEAPLTWQITVPELEERIQGIRIAAQAASELLSVNEVQDIKDRLTPGSHCSKYYCKAEAFCPALAELAEEFNRTDIESLDSIELLSDHAKKAPIVVSWAKAVEELLARRILEEGVEVPGFKAVQGKMGNREWSDAKEVEQLLTQSMKLKHDIVYDKKVKSPTALEKHFKTGDIGPKQWPKIKDMIVRSEAKLKVAPEDDPRPAVLVKGDHLADFETVE